jgi:hypothetical protein
MRMMASEAKQRRPHWDVDPARGKPRMVAPITDGLLSDIRQLDEIVGICF